MKYLQKILLLSLLLWPSLSIASNVNNPTSPGGAGFGEFQYNDSGVFAGSSNFTYFIPGGSDPDVIEVGSVTPAQFNLTEGSVITYDNALFAWGITATNSNYFGIGAGHFDASNTGIDNAGIGFNALGANTTGQNNMAMGFNSLQGNNTGSFNVGVGVNTLLFNTSGSDNIGLGQSALQSNSTGSDNVAIGTNALMNGDPITDNVAIGSFVLQNNTGRDNTAIGGGALIAKIAGDHNIAIGDSSLSDRTSGSYNIGIGTLPSTGALTGSYNVVIGSQITGLSSGLANAVILGDGQGNIRLDYNSTHSGYWTLGKPFIVPGFTVSTLPTGITGAQAYVTDALAPVWGATVSAGGSAYALVTYNGANWTVIGK